MKIRNVPIITYKLVRILNLVLFLSWLPSTRKEFTRCDISFKTSRRRPIPLNGCVGSLDGIAERVKWLKMPRNEQKLPHMFKNESNRKGVLPIEARIYAVTYLKFDYVSLL